MRRMMACSSAEMTKASPAPWPVTSSAFAEAAAMTSSVWASATAQLTGQRVELDIGTLRTVREQARKLLPDVKLGETNETMREDIVAIAEQYLAGRADLKDESLPRQFLNWIHSLLTAVRDTLLGGGRAVIEGLRSGKIDPFLDTYVSRSLGLTPLLGTEEQVAQEEAGAIEQPGEGFSLAPQSKLEKVPNLVYQGEGEKIISTHQAGRNLSAALAGAFGRRNPGTSQKKPGVSPEGIKDKHAEAASLKAWAEENGRVLNPEAFDAFLHARAKFELEGGSEHDVWRDPSSGRVIKVTKIDELGFEFARASVRPAINWIGTCSQKRTPWGSVGCRRREKTGSPGRDAARNTRR